ncbi:MAG: beta-galactosidase [Eubacteriales bacterium]|nr:beta-galactosidase [Eubacteriales bacterium]
MKPVYHTRHIPEEHLDFSHETAIKVKANGLCDTMRDDIAVQLHKFDVDVVETRAVWYSVEPRSGVLDWSHLDNYFDAIERAGFKIGVFTWFQHPPSWYDPRHETHARLKCLEHGEESSVLSLWDPKTAEVYGRLYKELSGRYKNRIKYLYVGMYGDYGEVQFVQGVRHYLFSPSHGHTGFWCGDAHARKSYADWLQSRYLSINKLNESWSSDSVSCYNYKSWNDDFMPALPLEINSLALKMDFIEWYTGSLYEFCYRVCETARKYFPDTLCGIPVGCVNEKAYLGQIKSKSAKMASEFGCVTRFTGMAHLESFPLSNTVAKRVSGAAHFYGGKFANEAALHLDRENAMNALYECLANDAVIIHDDPQNMIRAIDIHKTYRNKLSVSRPVTDISVFYPLEGEMLMCLEPLSVAELKSGKVDPHNRRTMNTFFRECAELRLKADFDICDSHMIDDGYLAGIRELIILCSCPIPKSTARKILDWVRQGGRLCIYDNSDPWILNGNKSLAEISASAGVLPEHGYNNCRGGVYLISEWPVYEPYASILKKIAYKGEIYITVHEDYISTYKPDEETIEILKKSYFA